MADPKPPREPGLWDSIPRTTRRVILALAAIAGLVCLVRPQWLATLAGLLCGLSCVLACFAVPIKIIMWGFGVGKRKR